MLPKNTFVWRAPAFSTPPGVAGGDPELWLQIFAANRENVLTALEQFEAKLRRPARGLANGDDQEEKLLTLQRRIAMLWEVDIYPAHGRPT